MTASLYRREARLLQSTSSSNNTQAFQAYNDAANQALEVAIVGVVIAAAGGGALVFGIAAPRTEAQTRPAQEGAEPLP